MWTAIGKVERLNTGIQNDRAFLTVMVVLIGLLVPINSFLNIGVYLKMSVIRSCTNSSNGKLGFLGGLEVYLSSLHLYLHIERGNKLVS